MNEYIEMVSVRAPAHLYRGIGLSCLALFAPIFAVLYWLTIPQGTWPVVLLAQAVLVGLSALVLVGAARATIWVGESGLARSGPLGRRVSHSVTAIDHVLVVELYRVDDTDSRPYLVVVGKNGHALLRLHGRIYTREDMDTVLDELGAPVDRVHEPVTLADLNRRWPQLLAWYEWRPSRLLRAARPLSGAE